MVPVPWSEPLAKVRKGCALGMSGIDVMEGAGGNGLGFCCVFLLALDS